MRFVTPQDGSGSLLWAGDAWARLAALTQGDPVDVRTAVRQGRFAELAGALHPAVEHASTPPPLPEAALDPAVIDPIKAFGVGLNFRDHAADLDERPPDDPAWFIKASHTLAGPTDAIELPAASERVTAEAEIGFVIGAECRSVRADEALDYVAGVCAILDQTAEDILRRNPRFLTWVKNYPTFLVVGPELVTLDEFLANQAMEEVAIETVRNGEVVAAGTVAQMTFGPAELIARFSAIMPLYPGDLLSTGTPGAAVIAAGDTATARISGLNELSVGVVDA